MDGYNQITIPYTTEGNVESVIYNEYSGNYLFIEAFATWCQSCRISMAHLKTLFESINSSFPMLSISIDPESDSISKIKEYKNEYEAEWDFGLDHDLVFNNVFKISTLPTAFLFDADGEMLATWVGIVEAEKYVQDINYYIKEYDITLVEKSPSTKNLLWTMVIQNPVFLLIIGLIAINVVFILKSKIFPAKKSFGTSL